MNLPDRVITQVTKRVCEKLPWPANELCKNVTKPVEVVNQQKHNILGQVSSIEKQIVVLKGQTIAAAQAKLVEANAVVAKLDDQLQAAHNNLQKNILQTAVSVARADFALKGHLLAEAQRYVAEARRANARVNNYLCVWKKESKCIA
jgi:chromosome condensin MukBEF complex kleisin-like MukF subunit